MTVYLLTVCLLIPPLLSAASFLLCVSVFSAYPFSFVPFPTAG